MAVTVYKATGRARIQVLTHELSHAQVHDLQDRVARAIGAHIVDRTDLSGSDLALEAPSPPKGIDPAERQVAPRPSDRPPPGS